MPGVRVYLNGRKAEGEFPQLFYGEGHSMKNTNN
jgi:hypothetical protein